MRRDPAPAAPAAAPPPGDGTAESLAPCRVGAEDWPALSAGFADLGFEQSSAYSQAAARRIGAEAQFWALKDGAGRAVAAAALRVKRVPGLGRGIAWCPGGPLVLPRGGPAPDAAGLAGVLRALRAELAGRQGHVLRLRLSGTAGLDPATEAGAARAAGFAPASRLRPYRSSLIDLRPEPAETLAGLQGKWRTDLRFALKSGLALERGRGPGLEARFLALFAAVREAKGFRPEIAPEFHFGLAGPDHAVETLIATKDDQDVAGIVVGTAGPCATYLFGATAPAGRPLRAGYFLTWEAMALSRARGCLWYDLGGIDPDANPDVARFKERMNGLPVLAQPWQALPPGAMGRLVLGAEALRARLRGR